MPGSPIAYWASDNIIRIFNDGVVLDNIGTAKQGLATADNNRFLRNWLEVNYRNIGFGISDRNESEKSELKWFPYNKGGDFRKWYGNQEFVVYWYQDGYALVIGKMMDVH